MLRAVEAKEIGFEWEQVRTGLLIVKQMTTDDWLPEDVYMSLKTGGSTLYVGEDDQGDYQGFIVLRLIQTFHGSKVEIWCAHSATKTPLMRTYWPEIQAICAKAGASRISFSSAREEWQRAAKRLGFVPKQISYEFTL
jgi:hypothetical protein